MCDMVSPSEIIIRIIIVNSQLYVTLSFKTTSNSAECENSQPLPSVEWNSTNAPPSQINDIIHIFLTVSTPEIDFQSV